MTTTYNTETNRNCKINFSHQARDESIAHWPILRTNPSASCRPVLQMHSQASRHETGLMKLSSSYLQKVGFVDLAVRSGEHTNRWIARFGLNLYMVKVRYIVQCTCL